MNIGSWHPLRTFGQLLKAAMANSDHLEAITAEKALSYPAVWYGVNKIAGHIAQLPLGVYRRQERGADRERKHRVAQLLRKPNAYQTATVFREQHAAHSILQGNGRAAIVRAGNSMVSELIPLLPDYTATGMLVGEKLHATRPPEDDRLRQFFRTVGQENGTLENDPHGVIMLMDSDVLHVPGLTIDGVSGLPLIEAAQRNLAISLGTEKRLSTQMQKGFQGNLFLEAPEGVFTKQKDAEEFLDAFERRHFGSDKADKAGLLRQGIKANILQMNNHDAQFADMRRFQRQDAALWLGLEQILGDDSSVSYNSLEQKNLAYLMNTLNRWLSRYEQEMEVKLLSRREFRDETHFIRFNTGALLKSDFKSSIEALSQAITSTIFSPNEAREKLDMNPREGGDEFANPAITPGGGEESEEPEEPETPDNSAAARAVAGRLEHLIQVEANRVKNATKHENYVAWLDSFYEKWEPKLIGWLEELGLDPELATTHCEQSKEQLLDVCGESHSETLADNVTACVSDWPGRATTIMEAETNVRI